MEQEIKTQYLENKEDLGALFEDKDFVNVALKDGYQDPALFCKWETDIDDWYNGLTILRKNGDNFHSYWISNRYLSIKDGVISEDTTPHVGGFQLSSKTSFDYNSLKDMYTNAEKLNTLAEGN
ncbi:MAG: hypothetical protein ABFQ65_00740 [Nanoarchaeota archaeon]